jgi:uncharacterized protein YbjT (DUF2867 family)
MKIIVTGSLGNISKPLVTELVQKGYHVTVISSNPDKQKEIEALGATAAIGSLENVDFLSTTFKGADVVHCMVPPNNYFDQNLDLILYYEKIANNYKKAIQESGVKQVIYLSSIGGHLAEGNGILVGHYKGEQIINTLPKDVNISIMRPTEFYYNLFGFLYLIKRDSIMASVCGGDVVNVWVSPTDIAATTAEEIEKGISGRKVQYIAGEEVTYNELATVIGVAVGKPDLSWVQITTEQMLGGLVAAGLQPKIAAGLVEMYNAINTGLLYEDYKLNKPTSFGKVKISDFVKDFAKAYNV